MKKAKLSLFSLILLPHLVLMPGIYGCDHGSQISADELEKTKTEIDAIVAEAKASQDGFILEKITSKWSELVVRVNYKSPDWPDTRRRMVELLFQIQASIQAAMDPKFDIKNVPTVNNSPGGGYPSGIAPEAISEREIRIAYEEKLEKIREQIREFNFQYGLRRFDQDFQLTLETVLVDFYQLPPRNPSELDEVLSKHNVETKMKERIIQKSKAPG